MSELNVKKMKVAELRDELAARGLDTKGTKPVLLKRLEEAILAEGNTVADGRLYATCTLQCLCILSIS